MHNYINDKKTEEMLIYFLAKTDVNLVPFFSANSRTIERVNTFKLFLEFLLVLTVLSCHAYATYVLTKVSKKIFRISNFACAGIYESDNIQVYNNYLPKTHI